MRLANLRRRAVRAGRRQLRAFTPAGHAAARQSAAAGMPVLFVGGTGRSGTSVMGRLLGAHPDYAELPSETKFLTGPGGLCDLARDPGRLAEFEGLALGSAFENPFGRGLHMMATPEAVGKQLVALRKGLRVNPWAAAATFAHALLDPVATAAGKRGWVDTTPTNVAKGAELLRLFPNMKLVHMVRDGRDVAVSVTRRRWGPDDPDEALAWWYGRLERGFAASAKLPASRLLVVQMEDLFVRDREPQLARLLEFLGLAEDPAIRIYFDGETPASKAHAGRWSFGVAPQRLAAFEAHHARLAARLLARGRPYRPVMVEPAQSLDMAG